MSIFNTVSMNCPRCKEALTFEVAHSVNAGRRPEMRRDILRGEFQRKSCPVCGAGFRLDAGFVYVDIAREQWLSAQPVTAVDQWQDREEQVRELFASAYGAKAPALARELGEKLRPRLVFGWSALREKLIAAEAGLDDAVLELLKMAMLRNLEKTPFSADTTLRLLDYEPKRLLMGWVRNADDALGDLRWVARELYGDIVADLAKGEAGVWSEARAMFDGALFVDVDRLMVRSESL